MKGLSSSFVSGGGSTIVYRDDPASRHYTFRPEGPLTTVKRGDFCPISNLLLGKNDPRAICFLVHGKRKSVNGEAFMTLCLKNGWPTPEIKPGEAFDINAWLIERALDVSQCSTSDVGAKWAAVTRFASAIGLKTNFIKAIRA